MALGHATTGSRTRRGALLLWILLLAIPACSRRPGTIEVRPESTVGGAGQLVPTLGSAAQPSTSPRVHVPLLLRPDLQLVRAALEEEDTPRAVSELGALVARGRSFDLPECHYLLGVLSEKTGATTDAIRAFEIAASTDWALRREAAEHLIRLELRQRNCSRAEALLASNTAIAKDQLANTEFLARIDLCSKNWQKAAARLRWLIASASDEGRRPERQLLLAQASLEQVRIGQMQAAAGAREVAELLREVMQHVPLTSGALEEARRILGDLLTLPRDAATEFELSNERAMLLEALVEARRWAEAKVLSKELLAQIVPNGNDNLLYCRVAFASGRIAAGTSNPKAADDSFTWVGEHCEDDDLAARALFLAAGQRLAAKKRAESIMLYAELERRFPSHRLADDARLKQALIHRTMGADSRFVTLLDSMYDVYPNGDMVPEALFQLALRRMSERNWSEALSVLQRTSGIHKTLSRVRSVDIERNDYFLARALLATGKLDAGLEQLRDLIVRKPLSYYMLQAYSTLTRLRPELASQVLNAASDSSAASPELDRDAKPGETELVERIAQLLGVGDVQAAELAIYTSGGRQIGQRAALSIAAGFAQVGATSSALALIKKLGIDCRNRWPMGAWMDIWRQAYPRPYLEFVRRESLRTSVPESLIYAIMREESEFDPKAVSIANAYGLMQLIVPTARTVARELGVTVSAGSLLKPNINITLGASVLSQLMDRFEQQIALVAAGYNAGPGRPIRWLREYPEIDSDLWVELIEYPETRNYVKRVLESYATYRWVYSDGAPEGAKIDVVPERWSTGRGAKPD